MHIALSGPLDRDDVRPLLGGAFDEGLPRGHAGAPFMAAIARGYLERGHRVTALTLSTDMPLGAGPVVRSNGEFTMVFVPARRRGYAPNGWRPGRILDLGAFERRGLRRALEAASPDVVHAHWTYDHALAAIDSGTPHLITVHDSPLVVLKTFRTPYYFGRYLMARRALREARHLTAVTGYLKADIEPMARVPAEVIPNGVDDAILAMPRAAERDARAIIMCNNGWNSRKNVEEGLRAFALLRAGQPEARLICVGHGYGPGEQAAQWAGAEGLSEGVSFWGAMPRSDFLALAAGCGVFLHPAREESFGMVLAETMALGLPVVAGRNSGAVPFVVGSEAGLLVDIEQPAEIAKALGELLAAPHRAETMGQAGVERVRTTFLMSAVVERYLARLEAIAAERR